VVLLIWREQHRAAPGIELDETIVVYAPEQRYPIAQPAALDVFGQVVSNRAVASDEQAHRRSRLLERIDGEIDALGVLESRDRQHIVAVGAVMKPSCQLRRVVQRLRHDAV